MSAMTLLVGALAGLCCLVLTPGRAIGVLVLTMLLWPDYIPTEIGPVDLTAGRIAAIVLLGRLALMGSRRFRFGLIDTLVIGVWLWELVANVAADASPDRLTYLIGRSLDTIVFYFVARLGVQSWADIRGMFAPLALGAAILAPLALMESVTSSSVFDRLYNSQAWRFNKPPEYRLGLLRAKGSAAHYIYFGMTMVFVTALLFSLRRVARPRWSWGIVVIAGCVGAFASLSSGPWVALAVFFACAVFHWKRTLIKPTLAVVAVMIVLVELGSNRHFYELVDYIALSGGTAWYRTKLMEVAFAQLHEYWLFGFGSRSPNHWGELIDGRNHVDLVNNYIIVATRGGLLALAGYVATKIALLVRLTRAARTGPEHSRYTAFAFASLLVAIAFAEMSVGLFAVPLKLYYLSMGVAMSPALLMHRSLVPARAGKGRARPRAHARSFNAAPPAGFAGS